MKDGILDYCSKNELCYTHVYIKSFGQLLDYDSVKKTFCLYDLGSNSEDLKGKTSIPQSFYEDLRLDEFKDVLIKEFTYLFHKNSFLLTVRCKIHEYLSSLLNSIRERLCRVMGFLADS